MATKSKILDTDPSEAKKLADELSANASDGGTAESGAAGDPLSGDVVVLLSGTSLRGPSSSNTATNWTARS